MAAQSKKVILGMDWGSTNLRVSILETEEKVRWEERFMETEEPSGWHSKLYFDGTTYCDLLNDGNGEIEDAHRDLALTDDNQLVACSSATTSPQVEEAAPMPEGTPQAKRMMKRTRQMAPMARLSFTPNKRAKSAATSSDANDTPSYEEARENPVNGMSVSALQSHVDSNRG